MTEHMHKPRRTHLKSAETKELTPQMRNLITNFGTWQPTKGIPARDAKGRFVRTQTTR